MPIAQDQAYFAGRAAKSRALASAAVDPGIRNIYLQRAKRYEALARGDPQRPQVPSSPKAGQG